jgi:glycine cleavage system H protein
LDPKDYRYTKTHEWIALEQDKTARIGISQYAQSHLGDIVFVDLSPDNSVVKQYQKIGEIESVKAVSEFYSPASGHILEINKAILDEPKVINEDCYGQGWFAAIALSDPSEMDKLMTSSEYDSYVAGLQDKKHEV